MCCHRRSTMRHHLRNGERSPPMSAQLRVFDAEQDAKRKKLRGDVFLYEME